MVKQRPNRIGSQPLSPEGRGDGAFQQPGKTNACELEKAQKMRRSEQKAACGQFVQPASICLTIESERLEGQDIGALVHHTRISLRPVQQGEDAGGRI